MADEAPFPADGSCPHCTGDLRYVEDVEEYRSVHVDTNGAVTIVYTNEHGDGDGINERIECRMCLATFALPDQFEWG